MEWANDRKIKRKKDKFQRWGLREKKNEGEMEIREVLKGKEIKKMKNEKKRIVTIEIYENKAGRMQ